MKPKLGFHTNCRCGKTLEETLQYIKAAEFTHVMIDTKRESLETGIKLAQNIGLVVDCVHLPFKPPYGHAVDSFWISGAGNDEIIESMIQQIKVCGKHGVKVVIIHPSNGSRNFPYDLSQGVKSIQKILCTTKSTNVKLAFENGFASINKQLQYLFDNIKDKRFGLCYDSGHHYLLDPEVDLLKKYGNRCFAIHLHDNNMDYKGGVFGSSDDSEFHSLPFGKIGSDLHLLPFDGKINFEKVMHDIAQSKYDGVVMLESKYHRKDAGIFLYEDNSPTEFLQIAYKRAEELAKMLDSARKVKRNGQRKKRQKKHLTL